MISDVRLSSADRDRVARVRYTRAARRNGWLDDWEALTESGREQWRIGMDDAYAAIVDVFGAAPGRAAN